MIYFCSLLPTIQQLHPTQENFNAPGHLFISLVIEIEQINQLQGKIFKYKFTKVHSPHRGLTTCHRPVCKREPMNNFWSMEAYPRAVDQFQKFQPKNIITMKLALVNRSTNYSCHSYTLLTQSHYKKLCQACLIHMTNPQQVEINIALLKSLESERTNTSLSVAPKKLLNVLVTKAQKNNGRIV